MELNSSLKNYFSDQDAQEANWKIERDKRKPVRVFSFLGFTLTRTPALDFLEEQKNHFRGQTGYLRHIHKCAPKVKPLIEQDKL